MENKDENRDWITVTHEEVDRACPSCGEHRGEFGNSFEGEVDFRMLHCGYCGKDDLISDGEGHEELFKKMCEILS